MDVVVAFLAVVATLVGVWFANNYRRQMKMKLAEGRRTAYGDLWVLTGLAAPTRLDGSSEDGPLTITERQDLYEALADWYYADGNGMLLDTSTRQVFLNAKNNLVCDKRTDLKPRGLHNELPDEGDCCSEERLRGILAIEQLSLLRTQLKSDLAIYGEPYGGALEDHECRFLSGSGVDLTSKTWSRSSGWRRRFHWVAAWGDGVVDWLRLPKGLRKQRQKWTPGQGGGEDDGEDRKWCNPKPFLVMGASDPVPISAKQAVANRTRSGVGGVESTEESVPR